MRSCLFLFVCIVISLYFLLSFAYFVSINFSKELLRNDTKFQPFDDSLAAATAAETAHTQKTYSKRFVVFGYCVLFCSFGHQTKQYILVYDDAHIQTQECDNGWKPVENAKQREWKNDDGI